jgi:Ca2+-binding EF-hand superfamily protein
MKAKILKASSFLALILFIASCNQNATSPSSTQSAENSKTTSPNAERATRNGKKPEFKNVLARVDTNNDGKISKSEAKGPLVNAFDKLDADGDGFITEKEFNEFVPPAQK